MSLPTIFVCGVTGTQGGTVARNLRVKGVKVHAVVRSPGSANAKAMETLGVKLWTGDYDNKDALESAMKDCSAAFLNLSPDLQDPGAELRRAKLIIDIAKAAGVKHFIYTSGPAVNALERLQYWDPNSIVGPVMLSKHAIEHETRTAGFKIWTILRPCNFMANYLKPLVSMQTGLVEHGRWSTGLERTSILPMVDTETIGRFACAAFLEPQDNENNKFHSQEIEIADEFLIPDQLLEKLSAATGRDLQAVYLTDDEISAQKVTNPFVSAQLMMRDIAQFVDLDRVRSWGIPLSNFDAFLEREKDRVVDTYLKAV